MLLRLHALSSCRVMRKRRLAGATARHMRGSAIDWDPMEADVRSVCRGKR